MEVPTISGKVRQGSVQKRVSIREDEKKKKLLKRSINYWRGFTEATTIHGIHYIGDPRRPFFERLWWAIIMMICFYLSTKYAFEIWNKWSEVDIQEKRTDTMRDISEIPLPAVTFCNNMLSAQQLNENLTGKEDLFLYLCSDVSGNDLDVSEELPDLDFLIQMSPSFNIKCFSLEESGYFTCHRLFNRIITDQGVCYTFNMMDKNDIFHEDVVIPYERHWRPADWSPDRGYYQEPSGNWRDPPKLYPIQSLDWNTRFDITLHLLQGPIYCDQNNIPGFKMIIHSPMEVPTVGHRFFNTIPAESQDHSWYIKLPIDSELEIEMDPKLTRASAELANFSPKVRKCYFPGEKKLRFFKHYSQNNCQMECLTNITQTLCECVDFYMPRTNSTPLCEFGYMSCIFQAYDQLGKRKYRRGCQCYPPCTVIDYHSKIYYKKKKVKQGKNNANVNDRLEIPLTLSNYETQYVSSERKAIYGPVDFLASCGGIFGLFCGMSIVSIIDFFYYVTLRLIGNFINSKNICD